MKSIIVKRIIAVVIILVFAAVLVQINSYSLALLIGGYRSPTIIDEGFDYVSDKSGQRWRVILAEKDGEKRLAGMEQGFLGFWTLPQASMDMQGEYEGLDYTHFESVPPSGSSYGYDYMAIEDTMTHPNNSEFAYQNIFKNDYFYHGANAVKTLSVPERAVPKDSTLQIYQNGAEYVLHFSFYSKGEGAFDGGFSEAFLALKEEGCIE